METCLISLKSDRISLSAAPNECYHHSSCCAGGESLRIEHKHGKLSVKKITVQVREDHLELLSRAKPMNAIAELMWNALDAEATEVRVEFVENELGGVETFRISDNGHGLSYDHAFVVFRNLGGSWKRDEPRTARRRRFMHGQYGKGRFRAFALGNRVEWIPVYDLEGKRHTYSIVGRAAAPGEFDLTDPAPTDKDVGMTAEVGDLPNPLPPSLYSCTRSSLGSPPGFWGCAAEASRAGGMSPLSPTTDTLALSPGVPFPWSGGFACFPLA